MSNLIYTVTHDELENVRHQHIDEKLQNREIQLKASKRELNENSQVIVAKLNQSFTKQFSSKDYNPGDLLQGKFCSPSGSTRLFPLKP